MQNELIKLWKLNPLKSFGIMDGRDWSQLPSDLVAGIGEKLTIYGDYVRSRSVCWWWRSSLPTVPSHLPCQFPWLMFSQVGRRGFYDPLTGKIHFLILPVVSPSRRICCSSNGWLVVLEEGPDIFCLNPLTKAKVYLPPLSSFPNVTSFDFCNVGREYVLEHQNGGIITRNLKQMRDGFLKKIILSDSPGNGGDYVAMAMLGLTGELAFCKRGDSSWKFIPGIASFYEDIIYCNGFFYGVSSMGHLSVIDVTAADLPCVRTIHTISPPGDLQYLVHSKDALLLVCRHLEVPNNEAVVFDVYETTRLEVYRLNEKWELLDDMEDYVVFLGKNSSFLLPVSDFPGCKGNRVYFSDDHSEYNYDVAPPCFDMGIFNLKDGSVEKLPYFVQSSSTAFALPAPIWVSPNPC